MPDADTSSNTETSTAESMEQRYNAREGRRPSLAQPWTIHRVPHSIRAVDKDAYEPKMLSIGPFHRSNPNLKAMEDHKWRYVQAIISRDGRNPRRELSDYLKEMKGLELRVRRFYSENIEIESKEFVEMMLLDGCFIVELLLNVNHRNATAGTDDPIYSAKWILPIIRLDMLLLENQLPFLVVERIFQLVNGTNTSSSIVELAIQFFEQLMPMQKEISSANLTSYSRNSIHHLLHLYHMHLIPTPQSDTTEGGNTSIAIDQVNRPRPPRTPMMTASVIRHALLLRKKENASSIVEVNIKGGRLGGRLGRRLEIPRPCINHSTNSVFRNLIAWEHCYPRCGARLTCYAIFMDCLVDSPQDIQILDDLDIIEHWLGTDEEVARLFNQMCIGITYDWEDNFLSDLFKLVDEIKRGPCTSRPFILKRHYYPDRWYFLNFVIAAAALCFAAEQFWLAYSSAVKRIPS